MTHSIALVDHERFATHEAAHAVVAVLRGFRLLAIRLDGPTDTPGTIWKLTPDGQTAENNSNCARNEIAVYSAGYLAEEKRYPNVESRAAWKGLDVDMSRFCALQAIGTPADFEIAQKVGPKYDQWPQQRWDWAKFQRVIEGAEADVRQLLNDRWEPILTIAERLLDSDHDGKMWGEEVYDVLGVPWPGQQLVRQK